MKNLKIILSKTRTIKIINTIKAYCIFVEILNFSKIRLKVFRYTPFRHFHKNVIKAQ